MLPAVLVSQLFRDEMEFLKKHCLESTRINIAQLRTEYLGTGTLGLTKTQEESTGNSTDGDANPTSQTQSMP